MCCATRPQPRKAATRSAHLCRGRGGRGCRCHAGARRQSARPGHVLRWRPAPDDPPPGIAALHDPPQRPQAPPRLV